mgnify:CR=1 FL=1
MATENTVSTKPVEMSIAVDLQEPQGPCEIIVDNLDDIAEYDPIMPTENDYAYIETGPFVYLIKAEILNITIRARMTARQAQVFEMAMNWGLDNVAIGDILNLDESTVRYHLEAAIKKAKKLKHVGVMTVIVETFGWAGLRNLMRE